MQWRPRYAIAETVLNLCQMRDLVELIPGVLDTENWPAPFPLPEHHGWFGGDGVLISFDYDAPSVEVPSARFRLPVLLDALVDRPGMPRTQLRIAITPAGPVCTKLTLVGHHRDPLTSTRLRIRLRELVEEAVRLLGAVDQMTGQIDREGFEREFAEAITHRAPGKRLTNEFLGHVADVYRYALRKQPTAPTEAVADAFSVSRSTAGRWLVEARKRGLLAPAAPGRAGEQIEEKEGGANG